MKYPVHISKRVAVVFATVVAIVLAAVFVQSVRSRGQATRANTTQQSANSNPSHADPTVDLSPSQLKSIKIEPVGTYEFPVEKETVGTISFADDLSVHAHDRKEVRTGDETKVNGLSVEANTGIGGVRPAWRI